MATKTTVLVDTLRFPESPRWHDGKLWCCDLFAQRLAHVDLRGQVETVVELEDTPTSLGWTLDGKLLVVSAFARQLLRLEEKTLVEVADLSNLVAFPCNDMVVDGQGRVYYNVLALGIGKTRRTPYDRVAGSFVIDIGLERTA